jgi:PAS domain-containing protein
LGLLYTDLNGRVVFVNRHVLQMLNYQTADRLIGRMLHEVLQCSQSVTAPLLDIPMKAGEPARLTLEFPDSTGTPTTIQFISEAAYDDTGLFIGVNISLQYVEQPKSTPAPASSPPHPDADMEAAMLAYFTAQVNALQVLLGRMGGPGIREIMEGIIDRTAAQNGWPVRVVASQITVTQPGVPSEVYRTLLTKAANYAASIIGRRLVSYEMQAVDNQLPPQTLELAKQAGLQLFDNHH